MAETFERLLDTADVYAQALFELAAASGEVDRVRAELELLCELAAGDAELRAFYVSRAIDADRRAAMLEKALRGRVSDLVLNTLLVMNRNGRTGLIEALKRRYVLRQEAAANEVEATATSAVELTGEQRTAVTGLVARLSGRKPLVEFRVEPEVLGGLVLQIGDVRYDNSLRSQLGRVRARLLERSERGLPQSAPG